MGARAVTRGSNMIKRSAILLSVSAALLTGCNKDTKSSTITIVDDSQVRNDEAKQLAAQAQREVKAGNTDKAIELYQKSLERSHDLFYVWNDLGVLLMERENYGDAAEMFKSAAALAPGDPRPYYNLGLIYQNAIYDEKALEYYVMSLERDGKYLPSIRGAIVSAKRLDIADEAALQRVRAGLLNETDPAWRKIMQTEALRIEGILSRSKQGTSLTPTPAEPPPQPPESGGQPPADL
jgi:tetratricopeptide (TPR) repeat protein